MNQTLFLSQLRVIALVAIAYCAGKGWLSSADGSFLTTLLPPIGMIAGPWIWSIYSNLNMKLVPHDSVAIATESLDREGSPVPVKGDLITIRNDAAKVVGALLLAVLLSQFFVSAGYAQARLPAPRALTGNLQKDFGIPATPAASSTGLSALDSSLKSFGDGVQSVEKSIVDKAIADLNAAITDATNHNDNISLPCWKANLALLQSLPSQWPEPPTLPLGISLSIQLQRDLLNSITGNDVTSLKVACAALLGDQLKIVANVGALLGIRIASGGLF
jgi:hypothetical protein